MIFSSKNDIVRHTESDHQKKRLSYFDLNVHDGKKPFQCDACDASYVSKKGLQYHVAAIHEGKKPFECTRCDMAFSQSGNLKRQRFVTRIGNIEKRNVSFQLFLQTGLIWVVCTENFCNFAEVSYFCMYFSNNGQNKQNN